MSNNRPACYAPWVSTYLHSTGQVVPCCEWKQDISSIKIKEHMSLEERFNHPESKRIRNELLASSDLPPECINCAEMEKHTSQRSLRQIYDDLVNDTTDYRFNEDEFKLLNMDYMESNLCNFSCMMCGSSLSSTHAKINDEYGKTGILKNTHELQEYLDRLDEVQTIQFKGGEPLLTESMWTTIKEVKRRGLEKQIKVSIVTNGSLLHRHDDNLIEILQGFKHVSIGVSIDCIETAHDYWRSSNSWKTVKQNCDELYKWKLKNKHRVSCIVRTAIGWPNAYAAKDVFDMFKDKNIQHHWNLITGPIGLSLPMLPQEELEKLAEYWKDYPDVAQMFNSTVSSPNMFETVKSIRTLEHVEKHRDITFEEAFPDMAHIYHKYDQHKNNPYLG